jgi:hypothetical protein
MKRKQDPFADIPLRPSLPKREPVTNVERLIDAVAELLSCRDYDIVPADDTIAQQETEKQLAELRERFAAEDALRRQLWGNRYPRRLGDRPPAPDTAEETESMTATVVMEKEKQKAKQKRT